MGSANFALLSRHYTKPANRTSANLVLDFGGGRQVELSDTDVDAIAKYYDTLPTDADRYDFVYDTMSRDDKFNALLNRLGLRKPPAPPIPTSSQTAMDLSEREVKKNSSTELDRSSVRSAALSTALRQAYAKYPQAQSDIEALIMYDMDVQKNTGQELQAQAKINQRQDDIDVQMRDVNRQQSKKIGSLDDENDALSAELDKLSRELDAMNRQTGAEPEPKKDSDSSEKSDTDTDTRSYSGVNVQSTARAEKSQQRAADAEKRKPDPEPARLKPGSTTFKPLGTTVPMVKPTPAPMPTIDVIDQPGTSPAMGQMAQKLTNPPVAEPLTNPPVSQPDTELLAKFGEPAEPDVDQSQADLFGEPAQPKADSPIPTKLSAVDAEEEPPLPANVSDLDQARRTRDQLQQATAQQKRDAIRTGTYNESQELRRMRELAGLAQ
jgi:hypothetical protein